MPINHLTNLSNRLLDSMKKIKYGKTQLVVDDQMVFDSTIAAFPPEISPTWLTHGIDFEKRRLDLTGEVNESMLACVQRALTTMNDINHDPIEIHLCSYGGGVYEGLAIYDMLRESQSPIKIIASGIIASSGILILLGADVRVARKHTRFMIHSLTSPINESDLKVKDLLVNAAESKKANDIMFRIIAERSKISFKTLQSASGDLWFGMDEAKQYGVLKESKPTKRKAK